MKVFIENFFKKYGFNSILFVNFLKMFFVMFVILCIGYTAIYVSMMSISKNNMLINNEISSQNMIETTENVLDEMKNLTLNIAIDTDVRNYIMTENPQARISGYEQKLFTKLSAYKNMTKHVYSVYLYNESMDTVISNTEEKSSQLLADNDWIEIYKQNPGDTMCIMPNKVCGKYPYVITFLSAVENKGCVAVSVDIHNITKNTNSVYDGKYRLYITDPNGQIIYSNDENKFMTSANTEFFDRVYKNNESIFEFEGDTYYTYYVEKNDRKYIVTSVINDYVKRMSGTRVILVFIMILLFVAGLVISAILAKKTFEPISELTYLIEDPKSNKVLQELKNNEVKYIATKIFSYIDNNNELREMLDVKLREHNELSMIAMQMQINPHFLNNSLNLIGLRLAKELGADNPSTIMVTSLTRLIQYILNTDTIFVDFRQELAFLRVYVDFLNSRYNNLNVIWDIGEEIYNYKIIRVCLQPIVENAVYHGLAMVEGEKILKISARRHYKSIVICIEDNGVGMTSEKLNEVKEQMQSTEISSKHIGIKNVYNRLKIVYEELADINIESEVDKYTKVTIIVPPEF